MRWKISTLQTCALVSLISAVSEVTPEIELCVSAEGIHMRQEVRHGTILLSLWLAADGFEEYCFEGEPSILTLPSDLAIKVLHTSAITDCLSISYDKKEHPNKATILLRTPHTERLFSIPAMCVEGAKPRVETRVTYEKVVHMHTSQLTHLAHHLLPYSSTFKVTARNTSLSFSFDNNKNSCIARGSVHIGQYPNSSASYATGRYSSEAMLQLTRCFALHQVCNVMIANDAPLVIELEVNELGAMKAALMPLPLVPQSI